MEGRNAVDLGTPQTLTSPGARRTRSAPFSCTGMRPDNGYCALLDYDLLAWQNGAWKTFGRGADADACLRSDDLRRYLVTTWVMDHNFWNQSL